VAKSKSEPRENGTNEAAAPKAKRGAGPKATGAQAKAEPAGAQPEKRRKTKARSADEPARPPVDDDEDRAESADASDEGHGHGDADADADADADVVEAVGEVVNEGDSEEGENDLHQPIELGDVDVFAAARRAGAEDEDPAPVGRDAALSRTDPMQAYLREVQRYPLLTSEEEKALTTKYAQTGDVNIAARLVTANLRLVVKLAYEYRRAYKNIMDLVQEGNIGLMQAVKRYDPYRGVKLSSYAAWWIRAYILRFILNNWRLVKLGTTQAQRKLFFNLNKEKAKLSAMGIEPTAGEIAERLSVDEQEVIDMDRRLSSGEASLDAPAGDAEGRTISRVELMPSANAGPDSAFEAQEMGHLVHDRLMRFRETLAGKDAIIFDKRMAAEDPLTLQELGNEFGISRERVRQLEARLHNRLRDYLREELPGEMAERGAD